MERAFHSLYDHGFITAPGDMGELTSMGDFVSQLGLDLQLGRLVGLGAQLDVLPEAIALAGSLSLPKMPWRITTPLIHDDPVEFNKIASTTLYARAHWDAGICSEPLALLRVLRAYEQMRAPMAKHTFCMKHSLADVRMRQFSAQCQHLRERVARALSIDPPPPYDDPIDDPVRLNRLRLVLAWTSRDSVIKLKPSSIKGAPSAGASVRAVVTGPLLSPQQVASIFPPEVAYSFVPGVRHHYTARVDLEIDIEPDALNSRVCSIAFGKGGIGVEAAWTIAPGEKENQFVTLFLTEHGAEAAEELVNLLMAIGEVTESMRATPYGGPGDNMPGKAGGGVIRIIRAPLSKSRERDLKKLLDQCTALGARYSARDLFCVTSVSDGFRLSDTQLRWLFGTPVRDSSENLFKEQALRDKQVTNPDDSDSIPNLVVSS